jgi:hypothetical protein
MLFTRFVFLYAVVKGQLNKKTMLPIRRRSLTMRAGRRFLRGSYATANCTILSSLNV